MILVLLKFLWFEGVENKMNKSLRISFHTTPLPVTLIHPAPFLILYYQV